MLIVSMFNGIIIRLYLIDMELRRDELVADWELAFNGENPYKIDPL